MQHTLSNGKKIKVMVGKILGLSDEDKITISSGARDEEELEAYIHELLHQEFEFWPENEVKCRAQSIARLLWQLGYRRPTSKPRKRR